MMAVLIELCFISMLVSFISIYKLKLEIENKNLSENSLRLWNVSGLFFGLSWMINDLVHCIFAMKYWVLS